MNDNSLIQGNELRENKMQTESVIQVKSPKVSPYVRKHLVIPSPIKKSTTPRVMNRIGAISSEEWRQFEISKEEEKQKKKDAIQERKLQSQKIKEDKQKQNDEKIKKTAPKSTKSKVTLTTKKKNDDSNQEFKIKCPKKRKLEHSNDIAEEAKKTDCNKIKIISNILLTPETLKIETCKKNKPVKKIVNRRETFRNEKDLENFLNNHDNEEFTD